MCCMLIFFCNYVQIVMSNPHSLDRFFGKPVDESMNVFRNPKLYPYVYIDEQSNYPNKSILKTIHWDKIHPSDKSFNFENNDYCLISKTVIYGFLGFAGLLFILVIGHIIKNCIKKRQGNVSKCQGSSNGCDANQCDICQNVTNDY
eukprot:XP_003247177.3 PREDICTED: uncharacterized protein LOC100569516 [Acyrthosiphon pisum]